MPKKAVFVLSEKPVHVHGRSLRLSKSYTSQNPNRHTILTDDVFPYVGFFYASKNKSMKYENADYKNKYGSAVQYDPQFYWKQAETFFHATKSLPIEASPLTAYYCMLNAAKSYIAYASPNADSFVDQFSQHGLSENNEDSGEDISTITLFHKERGVFPLFASTLDADFYKKWRTGKQDPQSLQKLLYNLPSVHRAYTMTYSTRKNKVEELFLPLATGSSPEYYKGSDGRAYLKVSLDPHHFPINATTIPAETLDTVSNEYELYAGKGFVLRSKIGGKWNANGSISAELRTLMNHQRRDFCYIRSSKRLWYMRKDSPENPNVLKLNTMTISMAIMHRLSEIARYKPEQLNRLLKAQENWLLHEYISTALNQFLDELASEITHQDIMCTGNKL